MSSGSSHRLSNVRLRTWLWLALIVGTATRLVLAFSVLWTNNDIRSYLVVGRALHHSPLHVYAIAGALHWPYGPVFFPWILATMALAHHAGLPFSSLIKLPAIAADAALAVLVYAEMVRSGFRPSIALAGGCLIALGPTFVINSSLHGQIDSVATLPAVGAVVAWRRAPVHWRALAAGLLVGLGTATKTPVGLVLLPLVLVCSSPREVIVLVGAALGVMCLLMAPFLASTPTAVVHALTFTDVTGIGGLPLVLTQDLHWASAERVLLHHRALFTAVAILVVAGLIWRRRGTSLPVTVSLEWLAFYSVGTGFFFGYLVWGIPFFLLAGYVRATLVLMALVLVPTLLFETGHIPGHVGVYVAMMTAVWAAFVLVCAWQCRRLLRGDGFRASSRSYPNISSPGRGPGDSRHPVAEVGCPDPLSHPTALGDPLKPP